MVVKLLVVLICTLSLPITEFVLSSQLSLLVVLPYLANAVNVVWELTAININDEFHSGHLVDSTALITSMGVLTVGTC